MDGGEETGARVRQIAGDVLGLAVLRPAQVEAAAALGRGPGLSGRAAQRRRQVGDLPDRGWASHGW